MKNVFMLLMTVLAVTFSSCEGPQGPPGFDGLNGLNGQDGGLIVSQAFEIEIDFNASNNYEFVEAYGFQTYPSDITLVYILWETSGGEDIWRLVPQNVFFDNGILTYNYDFTQSDVRFFLDGTIDFSTLDSSYTQNQIFRVAVVPADNVGRYDFSDLNAVMEAYGIENFEKRN